MILSCSPELRDVLRPLAREVRAWGEAGQV